MTRAVAVAVALVAAFGCRKEPSPANESAPKPPPAKAPTAAEPACDLDPIPLRYPAAPRVVAIGDLHGDLDATRSVLKLAGVIDGDDHWAGAATVVVQTGDILDRGNDEPEIIDLFDRLAKQARAAGGAVHRLNGNHELMNCAGDLRYVTPEGFSDFVHVLPSDDVGDVPEAAKGRAAAFAPGGPWATRLAEHNVAVIVGDTAFVHGGIEPKYAADLEDVNLQTRCWLSGRRSEMPVAAGDMDGPVWSRIYATPPEACEDLERALEILGVSTMVVGHTTDIRGISSACGQRVWRIDVGLSKHYGGPLQALEIAGDRVTVLAP